MSCLTDVELQSLADDEGSDASRAHATSCGPCLARLEERRGDMARLIAASSANGVSADAASAAGDVPASLEARVRRAVAAAPVRGATALRSGPARRIRPVWATLVATAAAIALVVFVVLPRLGSPTELSASQIIDRSLERMTGGTGVERLEYELVLASVYRQRAGLSEGPFRVVQVFDRGNPARFTFAEFDRDGVMMAATAQDPSRGRRSEMTRVDGRNYIVHVNALPGPLVSIPQLLQNQAASVLRLMQLNGDENLRRVDGADGRHYVIELPEPVAVSAAGVPAAAVSAAPLDLQRARVEIDGRDFRVREFTAAGTLLGMPFDISFTLIAQTKAASIAPAEWEIPQSPDDVVIEGDGQGELTDSMAVVLRELGKSR